MPYLLLLCAAGLLTGCAKKDGPVHIKAKCETISEAGVDTPMEGMPDDDQGIIHF